MQGRKTLVVSVALMFAVAIVSIKPTVLAQTQPSASERLNAPGPEAESLARMAGNWDVVMTFQVSPDAPATEVKGLVAHREMIGNHLQEIMQPERNSQVPEFRRISYLLFNRVEGRWQYVSLDTRFPVGIMPAESFDAGEDRDRIEMVFAPLGFPGLGPNVEGRMIRSNMVIRRIDADHDFAEQYWVAADGTSDGARCNIPTCADANRYSDGPRRGLSLH
jgi:hypothetical protein